MAPLLEIEGVFAGYGFGDILRDVHLQVNDGVTCIIGPNGAGKSTLLKTISGLLTPRKGDIRFQGRSIVGLGPHKVLDRGIAHVPQDRGVFPLMSVWDNLLVGGYMIRDRRELRRRAEALAQRFPLISDRRHERAGTLSGGQQKLLEVVRCLLLEPSLVLMDEPSMGLDAISRGTLFGCVASLQEAGVTVLMVEQNARSGLKAARDGVVMDGGAVRMTGAAGELLTDPEVEQLYLGKASHLMGLARD